MLGKLAPRRWFMNIPLLLAVLVLCGHVSCDCPLPERPIPDGTVTADDVEIDDEATVAEDLTILNFTCSEGYSLFGETLIQCEDEEWTSEMPFCGDIRCSDPPSVANATAVFEEGNASGPSVGAVVRYSCRAGYGLWDPDASVQRCSLDRETRKAFWEGDLPYCMDILCSDPPSVVNAISVFEQGNPSGHLMGSVVRYSCAAGYELFHPNVSSLRCSMDRETRKALWEGELPHCLEQKDCKDPGTSPDGDRSGDCCSTGSTLTFSCNDTHALVGDPDITCDRTGLWSARRPLCRPLYWKYCEFPDPTPHARLRGTKNGDYFVPEENAEVWCEPGYSCEGNEVVECVEGGIWAKEFGVCKEVFCERPPPIENGKILGVTDTNLTSFHYSSDIHYVCDDGYRVEGGDSWRMCIKYGVWSSTNPSCQVIRCPDPGIPENGMRSSSDFSVGSRISFSCFSGYDLLGSEELFCQANGQWEGELARCNDPDNFCPDPGTPIRGSKDRSNYQKGTKVRFSCDPWSIMRGSNIRECLPDGTWTGTPTKCIGLYDFDNAAQVKHALMTKMTDIKERERLEMKKFKADGRAIVDMGFKGRTILYFAFDVSGSIPKDSFEKSVDIAKAIVKLVGVSSHGTRVGAVTFASKTTGIFLPLHLETVEDVLNAFDAMKNETTTGGGTSASSALHFIRQQYMPLVAEEIPNATIKTVIFILTDGRANMGGNPKREASVLKEEGVDIYCVGITGNLAMNALYDIASTDPQTKEPHVFMLQNYLAMAWLVDEITYGQSNYSQCGLGKENVDVASGRVIGGRPVTEPWPWMAALYMTKSKGKPDVKTLQCGGSVIHPSFILTAAHCMYYTKSSDFKREPRDITVKIGLVNVTDTEHVQRLEVQKIHVHVNYSHETYDYDAALLELQEPVQYSSRHLPICLPPKDIPAGSPFYEPHSKVWTAGWGDVRMRKKLDDRTVQVSNVLKEIQLELQAPETCRESIADDDRTFTDRMFCAGSGEGWNDTCQGDSGGPVMKRHLTEAGYTGWIQVGVVSWGVGCGLKGEYGMYAHLHRLMPWVEDTIRTAKEWNKTSGDPLGA